MQGFWAKLPKPILALAPMANVTDAAFRRIIAKYGKPDVMFTEFVSADGLMSAGRPACRAERGAGREKLLVDLMYSDSERPIAAQLFSGNPEKMFEAGKLVKTLGFDGVDINMGCPDRAVEKSGAGAALIKNPARARELIRAAKEGASGLPVSVKTRLGYNTDTLEEWLPALLAEKPAAVTIHARTRKEMSNAPARWGRIRRAVEIRNELKSAALILGNGDVKNLADAYAKAEETDADGVALGRAIFGTPWLFAGTHTRYTPRDSRKCLKVMVEHAKSFEKLLGKHKPFAVMKKHFKAYVEGFPGAKALRAKLMKTSTAAEVENLIAEFLKGAILSKALIRDRNGGAERLNSQHPNERG